MSLASGSRLGPYEIVAPLGAGGMGEVYRATDTQLSRQVAIKILPDALASDPERLARFDREARTLAALNHPNIAAIYGIERSGSTSALVMELVEGATLADRIEQGAIPLDEALPIALQITKALEAAHEQGIVHRDLKPANVKVRPDGTVKVLDFGLAKIVGPPEGGPHNVGAGFSRPDGSLSPTITSPAMMTGAGIILGTAAYMSPEQARGRAVDKRADIWAFGAVLYEMLTGERAFQGEDVSDTLADVMRGEPSWAKLPAAVPPALRTFLKRCLRKNPSERVRDIGDVRLALEGAFDAIVPAAPVPAGVEAATSPLWRRALPAGVALAVAAAALVAGWTLKPVEPPPVIRTAYNLPPERGFRGMGRQVLAISPDGRQLVYNGSDGLYLRTVDTFGDRLISGTGGVITGPVFSPDGRSIAFFEDGSIRRMTVTGGSSVPLVRLPPPATVAGMSWEADGTIVYSTSNGVWEVSDTGGEPRRLLEHQNSLTTQFVGQYAYPQRLPSGDWLLVTEFRPGPTRAEGDVLAISRSSGERRILRRGAFGGRYVSSGHLLYTDGGVLYAAPFDAKRVELTGGAAAVVEGLRDAVGLAALPQLTVSETGTLAYIPGPIETLRGRYSLAQADRTGVVNRINVSPGPFLHVRATRDGTRLAIDSDDSKEANIHIHDMSGTVAMRRLTLSGRNLHPVWSPDGRRIAYQSDRGGDLAIWVQNADGTGAPERLTTPAKGEVHFPESWAPDGRHLSFAAANGAIHTLWIYSFADRQASKFSDVRSTEPIGSVFSPTGRWIAYHVRREGDGQTDPSGGVWVEAFPANGSRYQAPRVNFDFQPLWSHDGSELLYLPSTASGRMASARFVTSPAVGFTTPVTFPFVITAGRLSGHRRAFDVLPDGRFVSLSNENDTAAAAGLGTEIHMVFNWFEELRRLAPPGGR